MSDWKKPQLIVIARSKPEEYVLAACKHETKPTSQPYDYNSKCYIGKPATSDPPAPEQCIMNCMSIMNS